MAPIPLGGGLNLSDAPGERPAGEVARLVNLRPVGAGRLVARDAATELLAGLSGTVVAAARFPFYKNGTAAIGAILALWDGTGAVSLQKVGPDATAGALFTGLPASWTTGVTETPVVSAVVLGTHLFLCGRAGAHKLEMVYYDATTDALTTPQFDFDGDYVAGPPETGDAASMTPRPLGVYNNILFAAGYGTEVDTDRPEMVRFSYLGLNFDPLAAGDAGLSQDAAPVEVSPGSSNLFDRDDYFMVGERGRAIRAIGPAMGRLLFIADAGVHHLFGYDRSTFNLEQVDADVGIGDLRSLVLAGGTAYWWAPGYGPVVYTGNGVESIGAAKIRDRILQVAADRVVGEHLPESHEVRFYYPYESGSRSLSWDYLRKEWSEGTHPFAVACAGRLSTVSTDVTLGQIGVSPTAPLTAPSLITVVSVSAYGAVVSWTNGERGVKAQTEVYLNDQLFTTVDVNGAATTTLPLSPLAPASYYRLSLRHRVLDRVSDTVALADPGIVTPADTTAPPPPTGLFAQILNSGRVFLRFEMGEAGRETEIQRRVVGNDWPGTPTFRLPAGETSMEDPVDARAADYEYRARHLGGGTDTPSPWTATVAPVFIPGGSGTFGQMPVVHL